MKLSRKHVCQHLKANSGIYKAFKYKSQYHFSDSKSCQNVGKLRESFDSLRMLLKTRE